MARATAAAPERPREPLEHVPQVGQEQTGEGASRHRKPCRRAGQQQTRDADQSKTLKLKIAELVMALLCWVRGSFAATGEAHRSPWGEAEGHGMHAGGAGEDGAMPLGG